MRQTRQAQPQNVLHFHICFRHEAVQINPFHFHLKLNGPYEVPKRSVDEVFLKDFLGVAGEFYLTFYLFYIFFLLEFSMPKTKNQCFCSNVESHLPIEHGSDRRETLGKRVSDDSRHFIFRRPKIFCGNFLFLILASFFFRNPAF